MYRLRQYLQAEVYDCQWPVIVRVVVIVEFYSIYHCYNCRDNAPQTRSDVTKKYIYAKYSQDSSPEDGEDRKSSLQGDL